MDVYCFPSMYYRVGKREGWWEMIYFNQHRFDVLRKSNCLKHQTGTSSWTTELLKWPADRFCKWMVSTLKLCIKIKKKRFYNKTLTNWCDPYINKCMVWELVFQTPSVESYQNVVFPKIEPCFVIEAQCLLALNHLYSCFTLLLENILALKWHIPQILLIKRLF